MARGSRTPEATELEFRKHYLTTGNVAASAKAVGLSVFTGYELAKRANADDAFAKARSDMRARLLPDAESMLRSGLEIAHARLNEEPKTPEEMAAIAVNSGLKSFSFQDVRPAYFKSIVDAVKVIGGLERLEAEKRGDIAPAEVVINIAPTADAAKRIAEEADGGSSVD